MRKAVAGNGKAANRLEIKRIYEHPRTSDGTRILVDRLWPRGVTKEQAAVHVWMKEIAPSPSLRTWFGHEPSRWIEFRKQYVAELKANQVVCLSWPTSLQLDPSRFCMRRETKYTTTRWSSQTT
jgi:uncharacterized protein YeaO (DUF488 family)